MKVAQRKEIRGTTYEVTPMPGRIARRIMLMLGKNLAPLMKGSLDLTNLNIEDVEKAADEMAKYTSIIRGSQSPLLSTEYETHFQGDMGGQIEWFLFCLEVNFEGFLDAKKTLVESPS